MNIFKDIPKINAHTHIGVRYVFVCKSHCVCGERETGRGYKNTQVVSHLRLKLTESNEKTYRRHIVTVSPWKRRNLHIYMHLNNHHLAEKSQIYTLPNNSPKDL